MNVIEIKLLKYTFRFRNMTWRQEFNIKFDAKRDRLKTILSHALDEVSGLKITSPEEAYRVMDAIPGNIVSRIFLIYKGNTSEARMFKTLGLYQAPEPNRFVRTIQKAEQEREKVMDRVEEEMASKFGRKELQEAREQELLMLKNGKGRGLTKPSPDGGLPTDPNHNKQGDNTGRPSTPPVRKRRR